MPGERLGIGRMCPRCGVRSDTLGGICPACGKPYDPGGLLERLPFMSEDPLSRNAGPQLVLFAGVLVFAGWVWLMLTHLVAGILAAAAAFVLLVAAIGVTNALADRGR